ncbi:hypothetical protein QOZ84_02025 [Romboutsia sedimentorum]|uniref:Uncharacterized protein n=1 Tax=Romboutsia sedimentorum TaxID=1368474 RepID=A0ABT7E8J9_9FIRM|nr:hypothetical protein [Romboutsia sedimentorum]MDK2562311.1 hypothetical protein [Romboutsia sedimentorum]
MRDKALRSKAKEIIKNNKNIVNKTFFITIIFMAILFVILNPIIKNIVDIIMKCMELNNGAYAGYKQVLDIMSIGISLMLVTVFSDFILCSLSLDLIRNEPFNKESIKSRLNSIDKYVVSKLISLAIQSLWYIVLNLMRILISAILIIGIFGLFAQISNQSSSPFSKVQFYFLIISIIFLVFLMFSINVIIFSETFILPFIALDTQNNFKKKDIFKVYMSVMKKNRIKSFKLILGFIPQGLLLLFGVTIFYYAFNAVSYTMILILLSIMTPIILALYPKIMITLSLAYERMYNYSESFNR